MIINKWPTDKNGKLGELMLLKHAAIDSLLSCCLCNDTMLNVHDWRILTSHHLLAPATSTSLSAYFTHSVPGWTSVLTPYKPFHLPIHTGSPVTSTNYTILRDFHPAFLHVLPKFNWTWHTYSAYSAPYLTCSWSSANATANQSHVTATC